MQTKPTIGWIGPGIMGKPMCKHLMNAGFPLAVYARRPESAQELTDLGAAFYPTPAELAANVDIVISMVSDTPDVEAVLLGKDGVIEGGKPGLLVVDMSTISPVATREIAAKLAAKGIRMLDAPVSGGDVGAIAATLTIMVGGNRRRSGIRPPCPCSHGQNHHPHRRPRRRATDKSLQPVDCRAKRHCRHRSL